MAVIAPRPVTTARRERSWVGTQPPLRRAELYRGAIRRPCGARAGSARATRTFHLLVGSRDIWSRPSPARNHAIRLASRAPVQIPVTGLLTDPRAAGILNQSVDKP